MESGEVEIGAVAARLAAYSAQESGVAVLAHTDAGTADYYFEGQRHENLIKIEAPAGASLLRLRKRAAQHYLLFELIAPMPAQLLAEMGELYTRELQARFTPPEMEQVLAGSGI